MLQPINSIKGSSMGLGQNTFDDASKMGQIQLSIGNQQGDFSFQAIGTKLQGKSHMAVV